jgi:hypothetical protein
MNIKTIEIIILSQFLLLLSIWIPIITAENDYVTYYNVGEEPSNLEVFDCDNDGDLDIITGNKNSGTISVLKNRGDGTFSEQIEYNANISIYFMEYGDINNDGFQDLICSSKYQKQNITILYNNGKGEYLTKKSYFVSKYQYPEYIDICVQDFDKDNYLDIALTSHAQRAGYINILFNDGNGNFETITYNISGYGVFTIRPVDFNSDGYIDLITGNGQSLSLSILYNNGNRTFKEKHITTKQITESYDLNIADMDSDGNVDAILSGPGIGVYFNDGFDNYSHEESYIFYHHNLKISGYVWSIYISDIDEDNDNDIITTIYSSSKISIFFNVGNGTFNRVQNYSVIQPHSVVVEDIDGDFDPDIITSNKMGMEGSISILFNNGFGVFAPDFDIDGVPDFEDNDDDNDGYNDTAELSENTDPFNHSSVPKDIDGDYLPDSIDPDIDGDGKLNEDDDYPNDSSKWEKEETDFTLILIALIFIILLVLFFNVLLKIKKKNKK